MSLPDAATNHRGGRSDKRRVLLGMFARRALHGLRDQRERILTADAPPPHDLDFYAHAAWQLREAARMVRDRLQLRDLNDHIEWLDDALPHLKDYRDGVAHALDDRVDAFWWMGPTVVILHPGGKVESVLDPEFHQEVLEEFFDRIEPIIDPDGALAESMGDMSRGR